MQRATVLFLAPPTLMAALSFACDVGSDPPPKPPKPTGADQADATQAAFSYFVGQGLSQAQSAGIVGNLIQESNVDPMAVQYDGGPGRGIAQWSVGDRWDTTDGDNVVQYAAQNGESPWDLDTQLGFIWYELTNLGYGYSDLLAAGDVDSATIVFEDEYEICGDCQQAQRIQYAEQVLAEYGGNGSSSAGGPCAGLNDGLYCGGDGVAGDANTLYQCSGGSLAGSTVCANNCQANPGAEDDICGCAGLNDGDYCGGDDVGGDPSTLYQCTSGTLSVLTVCTNGCAIEPGALDDQCN